MTAPSWTPGRLTPQMRLARFVLRLWGWQVLMVPPPGPRIVAVVYPHTSNWDFLPGILWAWATAAPVKFVAKHSLFRWPLGPVLRAWGGLPVDRRRAGGNFVQAVVERIRDASSIMLVVAPEGSRSRGNHWKSGFYHMALRAGVPIGLATIDWGRREVGLGGYLQPTGNLEADFVKLRLFYDGRRGRKPQNETPVVPRPEGPSPRP